MAFPISPTEGQTHTENNTVWIYSAVTDQWNRSVINPLNETTYIGSDGAPGGIGGNTQVIFNDNGSLASDAGLVYNKTTDLLTTGSLRATSLGTVAAPTISFTGDPNTGIFSPGADQVAISTNGTGRLFVDAAGNVGLGTATPAARLHLSGNNTSSVTDTPAATIRLEDTDASTAAEQPIGRIDFYGNDVTVPSIGPQAYILSKAAGTAGGGDLRFATCPNTSAIERLRITAAGLVGIGISSPSSLLHLADAGNITVGTTTGTKIGTATTQKLGFWDKTPVVQPTTGISGATFVVNSGGSIHPSSTFDGYTIAQVVAALRQLGILA